MSFKKCFIDGRWVETKERLSVISPWSGEEVGEFCLAGPGDLRSPGPAPQTPLPTPAYGKGLKKY